MSPKEGPEETAVQTLMERHIWPVQITNDWRKVESLLAELPAMVAEVEESIRPKVEAKLRKFLVRNIEDLKPRPAPTGPALPAEKRKVRAATPIERPGPPPLSAEEWAAERAAYEQAQAAGFPCKVCGKTWTGHRRCHCGACDESFSSPSAFDKHRVELACRPPGESGLVLLDGYWQWPAEEDSPWKGATLPQERAVEAAEAYDEGLESLGQLDLLEGGGW